MTIAFQNAGTKTFASGAFSNPSTVTLPTSISSGDLLLMQISADGVITDTLSATGWTLVSRSACTAPDGQTQYLFYRVADGSEGASVSVSGQVSFSSGVMTWVGRFTGVDTTTPMDATGVASNRSTSDASPSAVSMTGITTVTANAMVVAVCSIDWNVATTTGATMAWSSYTEIADATNNNWVHYSNATNIQASPGASGAVTGTATKTSAASGWCGHVVALRPAATLAGDPDDFYEPVSPQRTPPASNFASVVPGHTFWAEQSEWILFVPPPSLPGDPDDFYEPVAPQRQYPKNQSYLGVLLTQPDEKPVFNAPGVPTLFQRVEFGSLFSGQGLTATNFTIRIPNPTGVGNCLILIIDNTHGRNVSSITDDAGNTWSTTPVVTADAGVGLNITRAYVCANNIGGARVFTITFSATEDNVHFAFLEYFNVDTASPVGSTASSISDTGPSFALSSMAITQGSLVLHYASDNANIIGQAGTQKISAATPGTDWVLEFGDFATGNSAGPVNTLWNICQQHISTGNTSITPSMTCTGSTGSANQIALELKCAAAGTTTPDGIRVLRMTWYTNSNINQTSFTQPFPCTGNLLVATDIAGIANGAHTDSNSNTWSMPVTGIPNDVVSMAYAKNATTSRDMTITLNSALEATNHNTTYAVYDIQGADTVAPYVGSSTAGPTSVTGNFQHQPDYTPARANGIMIVACAIGIGPLTGVTAPAGSYFMCVTYPGETDFDTFNNADGYAIFYYQNDTSPQNWSWGFGGGPQSAYSTAAEFRAPVTFVPDEDYWAVRQPPDRIEVIAVW